MTYKYRQAVSVRHRGSNRLWLLSNSQGSDRASMLRVFTLSKATWTRRCGWWCAAGHQTDYCAGDWEQTRMAAAASGSWSPHFHSELAATSTLPTASDSPKGWTSTFHRTQLERIRNSLNRGANNKLIFLGLFWTRCCDRSLALVLNVCLFWKFVYFESLCCNYSNLQTL